MKFLIAILLTALLGYAIPLYSPWFGFAITSFVVAIVVQQTPLKSFAAGFLGLFLLWGIYAYILDAANDHILSQKVAAIFKLGNSSFLLLLISAFVGGLLSGFAALTGSFTRSVKQ